MPTQAQQQSEHIGYAILLSDIPGSLHLHSLSEPEALETDQSDEGSQSRAQNHLLTHLRSLHPLPVPEAVLGAPEAAVGWLS